MTHQEHPRSTRPFSEDRDTLLWRAVEAIVTELGNTGELSVNTAPDYVVGYICRELVAKKLIVSRESGDDGSTPGGASGKQE